MSQLDLAGVADVSTRHLSFVESGRSLPSREMLMRLAEQLDVPLRERNTLLVAAGYAPLYRERALADPQLAAARRAVDLVLKGHEPYPALAVDRHWTMVAANAAFAPLVASADAELLAPPVNVLRLSMHPQGLADVIDNWHEWRAHLLARLRRQIDVSGDATLAALFAELEAYPAPTCTRHAPRGGDRSGRRAVAHAHAIWRAVVLQHDDGLRHAGRHHVVRTRDRSILSRRRRHGRHPAPTRRCKTLSLRRRAHAYRIEPGAHARINEKAGCVLTVRSLCQLLSNQRGRQR